MRVLFVDDEPIVLSSLARSLRMKRVTWEPTFANSGAEALDAIEHNAVDIIVSDISMPEMDGVRLLTEVRARHPEISRVVLSGNIAASTDVTALASLHLWLAKPCPVKDLCAAIERLGWARRLIDDPAMIATVIGTAGLPSPPTTFARLSEATSRPVPIAELVAIVGRDPGLVAMLLKLVSSAFFGEAERVTSLDRAVTLVGSERLRAIVLAAELFRTAPNATAIAERGQTVAHAVAAIAPPELAGLAMIAGLLHDVGALAAPDLDPVVRARIGGVLLGTWGLPIQLASAVAYHRDPQANPLGDNPILELLARALAS